ncbi:hypothetical protein BDQ12DRAFT_672887 [Crucibulum laeve]|uniref:Uncharacterized protein n=1 Tax=Crucibulum laeve TaxID=68775 RepID=A0A5C3MI69_9AGAR|nr:hypothetical protein BDQ12DRAFT_672887 [Crucibulum laeve]
MIRRTPTLVPMSDLDVQDIRDMIAKQKASALSHQQLVVKMKRLAENPNMEQEDIDMLAQISKRHQEDKEKARRIGLPDAESSRS